MPLTKKGKKILKEMNDNYQSEEKAKAVFYALENAKKIKGVTKKTGKKK